MILVVEDNDDLRDVFAITLRSQGFDVTVADDGLAALRIMETAQPDAVVLDLTLRTLDGVSVLEELAAHESTRQIPVVIVTGAPGDVDISLGNVAAILRKPVAMELLVAAIKNALAASESTRHPGREGSDSPLPVDGV